MYQKGDIEIENFFYDARLNDLELEDQGMKEHPYEGKKVIQLPHSCDEWIIGGKEEAEQMIKDLEEAIKNYENRNPASSHIPGAE